MTGWQLPRRADLGGRSYDLHTDYRDILEIFGYLEDPDLPDYLRWQIALALFYEQPVPPEDTQAAMEYLCWFIRCGEPESAPGPKVLDWQQDAQLIAADINTATGQEIRTLKYLHWWTFIGCFHTIGDGQLSTVIRIRQKLASGKKLESWEQSFYRENRQRVELPKRYSRAEMQEKQRLEALLNIPKRQVKQ